MQLPDSFIKNIKATYGQEGILWLQSLPLLLEKLSADWNFNFVTPVNNISYNFVAIVKLPHAPAILKVAPKSAPLLAEAEWIRAHKKSVPMIYQIDSENNAVLMEKFDPGTSLKFLVKEGKDELATRIISQTILDLQSTPITLPNKYPHLSEHIAAFHFLHEHVESKMIEAAESIFTDLCAHQASDVLLHGDLHHDNILLNETSWKVIDPHGYIGDPCAEVGCMIFNPMDSYPQMPFKKLVNQRLSILNEMLPFDIERIRGWTFCLTMRSAAWDIEGFLRPNLHTVEIAKVLYSML